MGELHIANLKRGEEFAGFGGWWRHNVGSVVMFGIEKMLFKGMILDGESENEFER